MATVPVRTSEAPRSMTVAEFDGTGKYAAPCRSCGRLGMAHVHIVEGNQERVVCPHCAEKMPWGFTLNLSHGTKHRRKDDSSRIGYGLAEVLDKFKHRCVMCTAPLLELRKLGVGASRHHVTERYDSNEVDCPIVPICDACKPIVDARQKEVWRWIHRLRELTREPVPRSSPAVSGPRVSPDSVRAAGETPARRVEGLSDDDADV